jgi:DNA helicase-2/ATP-dependent DNA helicase PcrA
LSKGHNLQTSAQSGNLPADAREALTWFVNTYGLYQGSTRGLFITDWAQEQEASLEASTINLKSRGFHPLTVTGETLYKQADYLWKESRAHTTFGRPLASKLELDISGSDVVIVDNLVAPENSRHLWYLWSHLLYPRGISGKPTIITTPLSFEEFVRYGDACNDPDFCGKAINWEKLIYLIEASMITVDVLKLSYEEGLPPMLKAEYLLYTALKERGLQVVPQHVLSDYILDFALIDKEKRLDIEVDTVSSIGSSEWQRQEAARNLVLFSDGWQVLKFTTGDILSNKIACVDAVDDVWRSGRKRSGTGRLLTGNMVPAVPNLPVDDDVQLGAITYGGGPAAVCGGAGTGKTTCILQRVRYLLGEGINPDNILVLTHATDTQRQLKRSIEQLIDKQAMQRLSVFSWQDLGMRILKENMSAIKRKPPLKIEPSPQKIVQRLLAKAKKEIDPAKLELSVDLDEFYIAAVISMYKAHLISPKQAKEEAATYGEEIIAKIYQQLEDQLQKANRIDRDDVITLAVQVLLQTPDLRGRYQRQYEFVLIDEYQDVTVAQDMLGRLIAAPQDNLFLVGDEDETVCEAKNACPELFTELSLRIPQTRCFTLERNWRSHPAIVDHARQLAAGLKKHRVDKEYVSAWGQAPASAIVGPAALTDEFSEAQWVAQEIQLLTDGGRNFGDIAILFRHHVYATILEEALDQKKIHYQASNPISNFIPDEIEDMMAFLKLVVDPDGPRARECFERVCQLRVKEIDPKLSSEVASFGEANNLSYLKAIEIYSEATSDQSVGDLSQLVRVIRTMHQEKLPPAETIALVRRTLRLNEYYRTVKVPAGVNYEPLKKLTQLEEEAKEFKTNADFIKAVAAQKQNASGVADQGVQVLPILDSKGLEFQVVFMVGMSEGIFPAQNAIDLEEERRICYLGFTRAKELLYLSFPQMFSGAILQPSHFLVEARLLTALPPQMVAAAAPPPVQVFPEPVQEIPPAAAYAPEPAAPAAYDPGLYQAAQQQYIEPDTAAYAQQPVDPAALYPQQFAPQEQYQQQPVEAWQNVQPQEPVQPAPLPPAEEFWDTQPQWVEEPAPMAQELPAPQVVPEAVEPLAEPVLQPVIEYEAPQPFVPELVAEHIPEPVLEPVPEPVPEPVFEPVPEPVLERVPEPVIDLVAEPAVEPVIESVAPEPPVELPPVPEPVQAFTPQPMLSSGIEHPLPPELLAALEPLEIEEPAFIAPQPVAEVSEAPAPVAPPVQEFQPEPIASPPAPVINVPVEPPAPVAPAAELVIEPQIDPFKIYTGEPETHPSGIPQLPRSKGSPRRGRAKEIPAETPVSQPIPVAQPPEPVPPPALQPQPVPPLQPVQAPEPVQPPQPVHAPEPVQPPQPVQAPQPMQAPQPIQPAQPPMPIGPQHQPLPAVARHAAPPIGETLSVPNRLEQELHKVFGHTADMPSFSTPSPAQMPPVIERAPEPVLPPKPAKPEPVPPQAPQAPIFRAPQAAQQFAQPSIAQPPVPSQPAYPATANVQPQPPAAPIPSQPAYPAPYSPQSQPVQSAPIQSQPVYPTPQPVPPANYAPAAPLQPAPIPSQPAYPGGYYPQPQAPMQPVAPVQPLCPACHLPLEHPNARFCSECGFALPSRIPTCPTCSSPLEPTAKFCGECGIDVTGPVAGDSTQFSDNMVRMQNLKEKQAGWINKIWKALED